MARRNLWLATEAGRRALEAYRRGEPAQDVVDRLRSDPTAPGPLRRATPGALRRAARRYREKLNNVAASYQLPTSFRPARKEELLLQLAVEYLGEEVGKRIQEMARELQEARRRAEEAESRAEEYRQKFEELFRRRAVEIAGGIVRGD